MDRSILSYLTGELAAPERQWLAAVDLDYAITVARRVAGFGSYERGFRPAGSEAARRCAEYLAEEMRGLGVPEVQVESYPLDGWDFAGATVEVEGGPIFEAVAYGGAIGTAPEGLTGELVDCGCGTVTDYSHDVRGKIALIEMDLDALNWPGTALLEAVHHGAIGVICWPANHYAMAPGALHTHDLQVAAPVPMLNVSRIDGQKLRAYKQARLVSSARLLPGATGRNIVGLIPGNQFPQEIVIIGDHYDAWFDGFMDDAVGVGAVLALAKAALVSGYQPQRTLAFVLHDAEEYGQFDSPWDWCTGAFAQINTLHPEWVGRAVGAVIFELCGFREAPTYDWYVSPELAPLAAQVLEQVQTEGFYPGGKQLNRFVTTWEDSFSYSVAGIPSAANLEIPEFVRAHYYHTQFDTEVLLDPDKYALHVAGLGLLAVRLDQSPLPPYDFTARAAVMRASLTDEMPGRLTELLDQLAHVGERLGKGWERLGHEAAAGLMAAAAVLNQGLTWIGGDGMDDTMYPHEQPARDLAALLRGDLGAIAGMSWGKHVSYPVYRHQLFRHAHMPDQSLQWASGRVSPYIDVWGPFHGQEPVAETLVAQARVALAEAYEHEMRVLTEAIELLERLG